MSSDETQDTQPETQEVKTASEPRLQNFSAVQGYDLDYPNRVAYKEITTEIPAFEKDMNDVDTIALNKGQISEEKLKEFQEHRAKLMEEYEKNQANQVLADMCSKSPEKEAVFNKLDEKYNGNSYKKMEILDAGTQIPDGFPLAEPTKVYQYHSEGKKDGDWYSPVKYKDGEEAREKLSLPDTNTADVCDEVILEKGTFILKSTTAKKFGHGGGGEQYFVVKEGG